MMQWSKRYVLYPEYTPGAVYIETFRVIVVEWSFIESVCFIVVADSSAS